MRIRSFGLLSLLLSLSPLALSADEREAWERWSPLVRILPGVESWSARERRALAAVIRAKGGAHESDFVGRFDRHDKLRRALLELAGALRAELHPSGPRAYAQSVRS